MESLNAYPVTTKNIQVSSNISNANKDLKTKSFNNNHSNTNFIVSNSLNINKTKSKSRVKSCNKRYNNLTESENKFDDFIINDFNEDAKSINNIIKTETNKDKKNVIINKKTLDEKSHKINIAVNNNKNENCNNSNLNKKLPRDSKSPNIRNYRTKRNLNSISLIENNYENKEINLKKIQNANKTLSKFFMFYNNFFKY